MQPCWDQVAGNIWNIVPLFILGKFQQEIGPPCCTIDLSSHNWLLLAIAGDNQVETSICVLESNFTFFGNSVPSYISWGQYSQRYHSLIMGHAQAVWMMLKAFQFQFKKWQKIKWPQGRQSGQNFRCRCNISILLVSGSSSYVLNFSPASQVLTCFDLFFAMRSQGLGSCMAWKCGCFLYLATNACCNY